MEEVAQQPAPTYKDDDLVYVDPDTRTVVGIVEWTAQEKPKSMSVSQATPEGDEESEKPEKRRRRKFFPWGTYRSMKRIYKLEGKVRDERPLLTLDTAIERCLVEPFWD